MILLKSEGNNYCFMVIGNKYLAWGVSVSAYRRKARERAWYDTCLKCDSQRKPRPSH